MVVDEPFGHVESLSSQARRLAENLAAARLGLPIASVRVASLPLSGRPVAAIDGLPAPFSVSISHVRGLCGAAISADGWVGIDIVDPANASRALDVFFTADELLLLPDDHGLLRAMLWAAKEAAYKAAHLDTEFRPRTVMIEQMTPNGFEWFISDGNGGVRGDGCFASAGRYLVAVAAGAGTS